MILLHQTTKHNCLLLRACVPFVIFSQIFYVSHHKERTEKICLNCNAELHGLYCHVCGQENKEPKDSFSHLFTHFVSDIFHFDGRFFNTAKYLLTKPGFLPAEYMKGRRTTYLDPAKMYIFVSAIFFLCYFSFFASHEDTKKEESLGKRPVAVIRQELLDAKESDESALKYLPAKGGTTRLLREHLEDVNKNLAMIDRDTSLKKFVKLKSDDGTENFDISSGNEYKTVEEYELAQSKLPKDDRDNRIMRIMEKRMIQSRQKYGSGHAAQEQFSEKFQHSFPQMLFVSLPFFALILQLLYVRKKQFYYVDHGIFTLYLYSAVFVLIFIQMLISALSTVKGLGWIDWINVLLTLYTFYYAYKALKVFYGQKRGITIVKFIVLNIASFVLVMLLFVAMIAFAFVRL